MGLFGIAKNTYKGLKRANDLPRLIQEMTDEANRPLTKDTNPIAQYRIRTGLLDAQFIHKAKLGRVTSKTRKTYIRRLKKELNMASDNLTQLPANKAEVAALAIGLKELSINLDQQVSDFHSKGKHALHIEVVKFKEHNRKSIEQMGKDFTSQQAAIHTQLAEQNKSNRRNFHFLLLMLIFNFVFGLFALQLFQNSNEQNQQIQTLQSQNDLLQRSLSTMEERLQSNDENQVDQ